MCTALSCLSLGFFKAVICDMWGNIMSGCCSPFCPTSHHTLPENQLFGCQTVTWRVVLGWKQNTWYVLHTFYTYSACVLAIAPARREESFCFFSCTVTRGIFVQLHSLISLFSLVTFAVKIFILTAKVPHPQTSKRTQGTGWKIYNKLWGFERASEVHNIKSRCVSSVTAAG